MNDDSARFSSRYTRAYEGSAGHIIGRGMPRLHVDECSSVAHALRWSHHPGSTIGLTDRGCVPGALGGLFTPQSTLCYHQAGRRRTLKH